MDWIDSKVQINEYIRKYRFVVLVLLLGLVLMFFPQKEEPKQAIPMTVKSETNTLQDALSEMLSKVSGAGNVKVLLSQAAGEEILYQTDDDVSEEDMQKRVVIIQNAEREEKGLIRQINPPVYQGAVILCQGADSAQVRLAIIQAVTSATGLSSDRITVLKMK